MAVCNAGDGSLTPFIAKYCTVLGMDLDMARTMSGQELICAMSEKLNEVIATTNDAVAAVNAMEAEWEIVKDTFAPEIQEAVDDYFASSDFNTELNEKVSQAVAEENLTASVAQLESDVNALQTELKQVEQKLAQCAVLIGNSYLSGTGNSGRGFDYFLGNMFAEHHTYASDSAGFGVNSVATTTFAALVTQASGDVSFSNSDVDAVVFFSAIGDTYVLDAGTAVTAYANTVQTVVDQAVSAFPNATIYICFAEAVSNLQSRDSFSQNHVQYQYQIHNMFKDIRNCVYLGWIGWNINMVPSLTNGAGSTTHPNDDGYEYLNTAFIRAWRGGNPYIQRNDNAAATDDYFECDVNAVSPDMFQVKLGQTKPTNFPTSFTANEAVTFCNFPPNLFPPMGRPTFGITMANGDATPINFNMNVVRSGNNMTLTGTPAITLPTTNLGSYLWFNSNYFITTYNQKSVI